MRAKWRKRVSAIGKVVGDPARWDYETDDGNVLATVQQEAHGFRAYVLPDETTGIFGDVLLAKQAAVSRLRRRAAGVSLQPPAPG